MGLSFMQRGEAERALEQFFNSRKLDPDNPDVHDAIGLIYFSMEKFDKADLAYQKAIEVDPDYSDAYHNRGILQLYLGRYDEAIVSFDTALSNDLYRNRAATLNSLGWSYFQKGDNDKAKLYLQDAIEHNRLFVVAYNNLGQVLIRTGEYQKAINNLEIAVKHSSQYVEAYLFLGIAHLKLDQIPEARKYFTTARKLDPYGKFGAKAQDYLQMLPEIDETTR